MAPLEATPQEKTLAGVPQATRGSPGLSARGTGGLSPTHSVAGASTLRSALDANATTPAASPQPSRPASPPVGCLPVPETVISSLKRALGVGVVDVKPWRDERPRLLGGAPSPGGLASQGYQGWRGGITAGCAAGVVGAQSLLEAHPAFSQMMASSPELRGIIEKATEAISEPLETDGHVSTTRVLWTICGCVWRSVGLVVGGSCGKLPGAGNASAIDAQLKHVLQANNELRDNIAKMRRDYLRELTELRERCRALEPPVEEALQHLLNEEPVMFFEPFDFVFDEVTKDFVRNTVEEKLRLLLLKGWRRHYDTELQTLQERVSELETENDNLRLELESATAAPFGSPERFGDTGELEKTFATRSCNTGDDFGAWGDDEEERRRRQGGETDADLSTEAGQTDGHPWSSDLDGDHGEEDALSEAGSDEERRKRIKELEAELARLLGRDGSGADASAGKGASGKVKGRRRGEQDEDGDARLRRRGGGNDGDSKDDKDKRRGGGMADDEADLSETMRARYLRDARGYKDLQQEFKTLERKHKELQHRLSRYNQRLRENCLLQGYDQEIVDEALEHAGLERRKKPPKKPGSDKLQATFDRLYEDAKRRMLRMRQRAEELQVMQRVEIHRCWEACQEDRSRDKVERLRCLHRRCVACTGQLQEELERFYESTAVLGDAAPGASVVNHSGGFEGAGLHGGPQTGSRSTAESAGLSSSGSAGRLIAGQRPGGGFHYPSSVRKATTVHTPQAAAPTYYETSTAPLRRHTLLAASHSAATASAGKLGSSWQQLSSTPGLLGASAASRPASPPWPSDGEGLVITGTQTMPAATSTLPPGYASLGSSQATQQPFVVYSPVDNTAGRPAAPGDHSHALPAADQQPRRLLFAESPAAGQQQQPLLPSYTGTATTSLAASVAASRPASPRQPVGFRSSSADFFGSQAGALHRDFSPTQLEALPQLLEAMGHSQQAARTRPPSQQSEDRDSTAPSSEANTARSKPFSSTAPSSRVSPRTHGLPLGGPTPAPVEKHSPRRTPIQSPQLVQSMRLNRREILKKIPTPNRTVSRRNLHLYQQDGSQVRSVEKSPVEPAVDVTVEFSKSQPLCLDARLREEEEDVACNLSLQEHEHAEARFIVSKCKKELMSSLASTAANTAANSAIPSALPGLTPAGSTPTSSGPGSASSSRPGSSMGGGRSSNACSSRDPLISSARLSDSMLSSRPPSSRAGVPRQPPPQPHMNSSRSSGGVNIPPPPGPALTPSLPRRRASVGRLAGSSPAPLPSKRSHVCGPGCPCARSSIPVEMAYQHGASTSPLLSGATHAVEPLLMQRALQPVASAAPSPVKGKTGSPVPHGGPAPVPPPSRGRGLDSRTRSLPSLPRASNSPAPPPPAVVAANAAAGACAMTGFGQRGVRSALARRP
eukprot:TRINITY_DN39572_c0_g1_i1.p1 TRINITY_DN39572_c0_g1~~TRINITY_DN39572_c0_g1_i1.p1  ORF type:complete len:1426 (-),score=361.32 TRINITY_DN39572_c0_g1_i1:81-4295(-)